MSSKVVYAVYKGESFLDLGTAEELARKFKVKRETVWFWNSPANKKRNRKNRIIAIKIEKEEEE